ncbi:MAG: Holliday junction branch migration protein RuvA [Deltaproteobacteria bacterium]|nr:Holliday junction branch migration protein RuvA [Deltaproteobacteria bacterium]
MIGYLQGKIQEKLAGEVIINVNGVGYEVTVPLQIFSTLGKKGSDISLFIYTHVRENIFDLYGFQTLDEKNLFLTLMSVNGVGPKLALAILSGMPFEKLKTVLAQGQIGALSSIPGIGKKKAERLLVELKGKIKMTDSAGRVFSSYFDDAVSALVNLGYKEQEVREKMNQIDGEGMGVEDLIKGVLKEYSRA